MAMKLHSSGILSRFLLLPLLLPHNPNNYDRDPHRLANYGGGYCAFEESTPPPLPSIILWVPRTLNPYPR